jgi:hypothetical protein
MLTFEIIVHGPCKFKFRKPEALVCFGSVKASKSAFYLCISHGFIQVVADSTVKKLDLVMKIDILASYGKTAVLFAPA